MEKSEYVRKADVNDEMKRTRLQGLKDQLAGPDEDTSELQAEIGELKQRIAELTSFDSERSLHGRQTGG
jgi:ABC-type phosphate transport system auxiliary subunit